MPRTPQPPQPLPLVTNWRSKAGQALRHRRKQLCWSRERLAEVAGYSRTHVNKAERGEVSFEGFVLLCASLGKKPSEVFAEAGL